MERRLPDMIGIILFGVFFLLVFLNVPIAVSLGISTMLAILAGGFPMTMVSHIMLSSIAKFSLLAIPFFILAGVIMDYAGISKRLINLAQAFVGHTKSGLVAVVVIVACFFAAISGSGPATVAALGTILIPAMVKAGYDRSLSTALMSASGAIGIIIPPSIAFIVYASIANVSVGKLFAGGIIPGILIGISFIIAALWDSRNNPNIKWMPKASGEERWKAFKDAVWGLIMPVIILGGIYSGIFTPTEAAGVSVIYGFVVGVFVYREIKLRDLPKILYESAISSATVMYIIAAASLFAWILSVSHVAGDLSAALLSVSENKYVILLLVNIIFLIAGCFLEPNSAFYILIPIIVPVFRKLDISLLHAGVFLTVNMALGLITPPVGINLYVGCNIAHAPVSEVCKKIVPFLAAGIVVLLLITYIPSIVMFLPNML